MLEYRVLKRKRWMGHWITIYENPVKSFLVVEEDDDDKIISSSFHFFWKEALKAFNKIKHESKGK